MARYMRGYGMYKLRPPTGGPGIAWHGPGTYLTYPDSPNTRNRRGPHYKLGPPQVVTPVVTSPVFFGPKVYLNVMTPERLRQTVTRRRPGYALGPPVIIGAGLVNPGLRIKLAFGRSQRGAARLRPPAVVAAVSTDVFFGPVVTLARIRPPRVASELRPPTDTVGLEDQGRV